MVPYYAISGHEFYDLSPKLLDSLRDKFIDAGGGIRGLKSKRIKRR